MENTSDWQLLTKKYCPRCILRHTTNTYIHNVFAENEEIINEHLTLQHDFNFKSVCDSLPNSEKNTVCFACLGLLQDAYLESFVNEIVTAINKESYIFPSFQLLYSLPVQLMVLDDIAASDFKSISKDLYDDIKDVKQVMKVTV